jgi:hypothetical protein
VSNTLHSWPAALAAIATLAAGLASPSASADPYGFKGVVLGSHVSQIANNPKFDCKAVTTPSADRICSLGKDETETIAGARVDSLFYFYDLSSLTGITISLPEKNFQVVVKALGDKYGAPARSMETVKTLSDKTFENTIYRWRQPGQAIEAQRYAGRVDRSTIRIVDETAPQRIKQRREQIARQPHTDL